MVRDKICVGNQHVRGNQLEHFTIIQTFITQNNQEKKKLKKKEFLSKTDLLIFDQIDFSFWCKCLAC